MIWCSKNNRRCALVWIRRSTIRHEEEEDDDDNDTLLLALSCRLLASHQSLVEMLTEHYHGRLFSSSDGDF